MNPTKIVAFNEIAQWIKYDGFSKEDLAQILRAVNKECLKVRGVTISELIAGNFDEFKVFYLEGSDE